VKDAFKAHGFGTLSEIDVQAMLSDDVGAEIGLARLSTGLSRRSHGSTLALRDDRARCQSRGGLARVSGGREPFRRQMTCSKGWAGAGVVPSGHTVDVADAGEIVAGLSRSYLFEGMTADELEPLARVSTRRRLVRGEYVFHAGDRADELWVVLSGEVKDCVVDVDGNEVILFVHGPGMTLGEPGFFSLERDRVVDVIALEPTTLVLLDRRDLWPFMERHGVVKDRALEALASDTRWQANLVSSLMTRPLADRLVLRLLELVDSAPDRRSGRAATPRITQATLAGMIGVSRENVNRALAALALDGAIRLDGGRYVLLDEEGLRRRAAQGWPLAARRDRRIDTPRP
jgi:CRP/FNR family cyclic AMP-dependent transcriptional regulator